ncbi:MAG: dihydroorotate dehydrogenase-like protein [Thermoanaerobaculia bacterium]
MNLESTYLGLALPHPLLAGASPLADDLDSVRRLEDAGAAAIVMGSLFEEQIVHEQLSAYLADEIASEGGAAAIAGERPAAPFGGRPQEYLEHLRRVRQAVALPIIGSLNGSTPGGWLDYARLIEEAGADAIELNVYALATDPWRSGSEIEEQTVEVVRAVRGAVQIPLAVKLSPFYTSLPHFAERLVDAGADGLVLFNPFYQPDIDIENQSVDRSLHLSLASDLALRLRWLAILSAQIRTSFAVSGGVHAVSDVVKAVMTGADAVQLVSELLTHGPERLRTLREELAYWLADHDYESLAQMRGSMNLATCPDPAGYERANYMLVLRSWHR